MGLARLFPRTPSIPFSAHPSWINSPQAKGEVPAQHLIAILGLAPEVILQLGHRVGTPLLALPFRLMPHAQALSLQRALPSKGLC
jgi:hypothetical protein